ncbi:MAG: response regulator [Caulobacteraceae bacterium]
MAAESPPKQVAVIEDDEAVLHSLAFMLATDGHEVMSYMDPAQALTCNDILAADCMILDFNLPDTDGLSVLTLLRGRGIEAPALLIASVPNVRCRARARADGVPLFEKPLNGDEVREWVRLVPQSGAACAG